MRAHQAEFRITTMARVLGVSTSGYYAWLKRPRSAREKSDTALVERMRAIHKRSRGTYGAPRIQAELADDGVLVSRKRVARLMRESGLSSISRRKRPTTTRRAASARPAPDLVDRKFAAEVPDRLWLADITYVPTLSGFLYLAVVLDAFSRRIVGWAMDSSLAKELVVGALEMAIAQRRPEEVIQHSESGQPTLPWPSGSAAETQASRAPWAPSEIATTTPWSRASSPASSANCSTGRPSEIAPKQRPSSCVGSELLAEVVDPVM